MSSKCLFVSCPKCDTSEMVYVGELEVENFDIEGAFLTLVCNNCEQEDHE